MARSGRSSIKVVKIPRWAISEEKDGPALASAFKLADLEDKWVRLDAATQRKLIGYPVFGKQALRVLDRGVEISRSAAFGTDVARSLFPFEVVTHAARNRRKLLP